MTRALAEHIACKRAWVDTERAAGRNPSGMTECNDEHFIRALAEFDHAAEVQQAYRYSREAQVHRDLARAA